MSEQDKVITRQEMYEAVWQTPISKLAPAWGTTIAAIIKACAKMNIPRPEAGHWTLVRKGWGRVPPPRTVRLRSPASIRPVTGCPRPGPRCTSRSTRSLMGGRACPGPTGPSSRRRAKHPPGMRAVEQLPAPGVQAGGCPFGAPARSLAKSETKQMPISKERKLTYEVTIHLPQ